MKGMDQTVRDWRLTIQPRADIETFELEIYLGLLMCRG